MALQPYLFFNGRCEEAIEFYRRAIGAEIALQMRFRESPDPAPPGCVPEGWDDKVMHCTLHVGDAVLMLSDGNAPGAPAFAGFSLSLALPDAALAARRFEALADGGEIVMPLGRTFWSPCFGMVKDRFGVHWMVTVAE